jgi:hypothetical protein
MSSTDVAVSLSQLKTCIFRRRPAEDHCSGTKVFVSEYLIEAHMFDCCDCNQLIAGMRAERNRMEWSPEDLRIGMTRDQAMPGCIDSSNQACHVGFQACSDGALD